MKKEIWLPLCAIILVVIIIVGFLAVPNENNSAPVISVLSMTDIHNANEEPKKEPDTKDNKEMKAIWVPYMSLADVTEKKIDEIVAKADEYGYNAIIFHVRPFGDAFYESRYFPTSHMYDGVQGGKMSFDPLAYVIEKAHDKNIEVHAWVNPLRIQHKSGTIPEAISEDNPYNIFRNDSDASNDSYVIDYEKGKYFNPGEAGARAYIVKGIEEIVENYDVDGIHWDDYFYPADDDSFDDSESYMKYTAQGGTLDLIRWRTENINKLVKDTYDAVKRIKPDVVFGISPQGNIENCLNMGADVYEWCSKTGYVDYICPQVYWSFDHEVAPYDMICRRWRALTTEPEIKLYIGLALYKAGTDSDKGTWEGADDILAREVRYARSEEIDADGFMVYSYEYLEREETKNEVINLTKELERNI